MSKTLTPLSGTSEDLSVSVTQESKNLRNVAFGYHHKKPMI